MRRAWLIAALVAMPVMLLAQQADDEDEGRLVRFIEESLSDGAARNINLQGFRGALSSEATLDRLTVADADGIWLTIEGARLDWNRSALLRGAIDITALTAERVVLERLPVSDDAGPAPEATPFSLPDLPVSVEIETAEIARVEIGAPVFGQAVAFSTEAAVALSGGAGEAALNLTRLDGQEGRIALSASYDNASTEAVIDLSVTEGPGGLAVSLLNIPGAPPVALTVTGQGPIAEFASEFALATDGVDRLAGTATTGMDGGNQVFTFDVAGDLTPILSGDAEVFLGRDASISARATRDTAGAITLEDLSVRAAAVELDGSLSLDPMGQPSAFALTGALRPPGGANRLALPGGAAEIESAMLDLTYDAAEDEAVEGEVTLTALEAGAFTAAQTVMTLNGGIGRVDGRITGFAGTIAAASDGLGHADPDIAAALGPRMVLETLAVWQPEQGLALSDLSVETRAARLLGDISAVPGEGRLDLGADLALSAADLSPFGGLVGQGLGGAAEIELTLQAEALSGAFEAGVQAVAEELRIDTVPPDLLSGTTTLTGGIARDETGLTLRNLSLDGTALSLTADGQLSTDRAALDVTAALTEARLADPRLNGPVRVSASLSREGAEAPYRLPDLVLEAEFGRLTGDLSLLPAGERTDLSGTVTARITSLSALSDLAGQELSGRADLTLGGEADLQSRAFDLTFDLGAEDIRVGQVIPPELLAGETIASGRIASDGSDITFDDVTLEGRELTASAEGRIGPDTSAASLDARLQNAGIFTPALPGAVELSTDITRTGTEPFRIEARATGPGGLTLNADGEVGRTDGSVDLALAGSAPLPLANRFIAPRALTGTAAFDLALRGQPSAEAVTGRITTTGARLTAPTLGFALENIGLTANVAGGSADVTLQGSISSGGSVSVSGPIGFARPGLPAQLSIAVDQARLVDPTLYDALIEQVRLTLSGALTGSSQLAGQVNLGPVEVRVPESGIGGTGAIPEITHIGETSAERRTRAFAGLLGQNGGSGGSARIGLDIGIDAPGRIFLRGRGLDAELGGTLRLSGTTADPIPSGRFELIRGRLSILGTRLDLIEGGATLRGGDPYIELTAQSQAGEYTVFVEIAGPASAPEVSFRSAPDLPEDEVLAQLLFGRSASSLSPIQALQLADAVAGLAGGGSGIFTRLREGLGLDDLDIQTDDEGNAAIRAGRYLSENVYTDVTVDSEGTGVSLNIDLTPNITARGGVTSSGESSIGVFFERDY